ncbi:hypothetical protein GCM10012288_00350 [Malaciobacter pacificus]|uniref:Uncharacterized protein n=1 Tax=Malaciobacter pacificus TaxID=1080223 RepID=A0A5C2H8V0_9BACT|nr:ATP-binding protein [Malaciobacter pacificus]QEP33294.1 hypothetical protein APAC_0124 [Malaciobacter pacificus]GGD30240.1 hypothetical protein GCM10012288_00350 [Malaciobacter pacificus]
MEYINSCKEEINLRLEKIKQEITPLIDSYVTFFNIEKVFSSENGGKTRLNRQLFNENHEIIVQKILEINDVFEEMLDLIKTNIKSILSEFKEFDKVDFINLIFDDKNFLEILELDLNNEVIPREKKREVVREIIALFTLKNRIFNFKYYLSMIDTTIFDKHINKFGVEELINSSIIFEVIDSYGLQYKELEKFQLEIDYLTPKIEKIQSFQFLNSLLELHKRRCDNFFYANTRYKISIEYNNDLEFRKPMLFNISYLENIISCFIEQSCMDLVKQELKKGKIQKFIDINIQKIKGRIVITVKNNGFEIKNIFSLFSSDVDNKFVLEAKNLADSMNALLEIYSVENEGMVYSISFKA